jgi:hypothetical protein
MYKYSVYYEKLYLVSHSVKRFKVKVAGTEDIFRVWLFIWFSQDFINTTIVHLVWVNMGSRSEHCFMRSEFLSVTMCIQLCLYWTTSRCLDQDELSSSCNSIFILQYVFTSLYTRRVDVPHSLSVWVLGQCYCQLITTRVYAKTISWECMLVEILRDFSLRIIVLWVFSV